MGKNRDTQFAVFADNVCRDLAEKGILKWNEPWDDAKQIIARRAYNLVVHAVTDAFGNDHLHTEGNLTPMDHVIRDIPDMTKWPKE